MPDNNKQLHAVLNGLEKIKAKLDTIELDMQEINAEIDRVWEAVNDSMVDAETGITAEQQAEMGWPMTGEPEPYDKPPK